MWRALFVAIGLTILIIGAECLCLDKATLAAPKTPPPAEIQSFGAVEPQAPASRDIVPPDWAAWSLMSAGAVVVLYTFVIPGRLKT